jgi:hypothetical protein
MNKISSEMYQGGFSDEIIDTLKNFHSEMKRKWKGYYCIYCERGEDEMPLDEFSERVLGHTSSFEYAMNYLKNLKKSGSSYAKNKWKTLKKKDGERIYYESRYYAHKNRKLFVLENREKECGFIVMEVYHGMYIYVAEWSKESAMTIDEYLKSVKNEGEA